MNWTLYYMIQNKEKTIWEKEIFNISWILCKNLFLTWNLKASSDIGSLAGISKL